MLTNHTFFTVISRSEDLALLKWGYKRSREMARRMACYRGEFAPSHPPFPEGSLAVCRREGDIRPVDIAASDIQYTEGDEKVIEEYTRKSGASALDTSYICY